MRFKKIMPVVLMLLVVLTIGAVSAIDDDSFNETLTVGNVEETLDVSLDENNVLNDMGPEDVNIDVNDIENSGDTFVDVSLTEKEGNFVIRTDAHELFREDLSDSDKVEGVEGDYHYGISLDDVNAYISENIDGESNFYDVVAPDDIIRFVFEYQGSDFVTCEYRVDFDEENIMFGELDNHDSDLWICERDSINSRDAHIVRMANLEEGSLSVIVTKFNGDSRTYNKGVGDKNEENEVVWTLDELDIIDELGFYNITVVYSNGDDEITLEEDVEFRLTQLSINPCWYDQVHVLYPFDVLRVYDEEARFNVYVNTVQRDSGRQNPFRWTLDDLGIDSAGEYDIVIEAYGDEDNVIDTYGYTLNVFDDSNFMVFSPYADVVDVDEPVLYIYCPDGIERSIKISINDEMLGDTFEITENWMNWTLDDLGIDHDDGYDLKVYEIVGENPEEIYQASLDVFSLEGSRINVDFLEEVIYTDFKDNIIWAYIPENKFGKLEVSLDNTTKYISNAYPNSQYEWNLMALNITEPGQYNILVKFIGEDFEEILLDETITVAKFNNETFRAKLTSDYSALLVFCPDGAEGTITVLVCDFDGNPYDEFTYDINDTYYNRWTKFAYDNYDFMDFNAEIWINDVRITLDRGWSVDSPEFNVNCEELELDDEVIGVNIPFNRNPADFALNITCEKLNFYKKFTESDEYEWRDGYYHYSFHLDDFTSIDAISDKDIFTVSLSHDKGRTSMSYVIKKDDKIRLYEHNLEVGVSVEFLNLFEDDSDDESEFLWNSSSNDEQFVNIYIPDDSNISEAQITISSEDKILFKANITDLEKVYEYDIAGYKYIILFSELDFTGVKDKAFINASLTSSGKSLDDVGVICHIVDEDNMVFHEIFRSIEFEVHKGELYNPEYGMGIQDGSFIMLDIPSYLNITEGSIEIATDDGEVLFNKSLSSFDNSPEPYYKVYYDEYGFNEYVIYSNESFYNTYIPRDVNLTFTFNYGDNKILRKGVRIGDAFYTIITVDYMDRLFSVTIEDKVLVDGEGAAIHIAATGANRQNIYIDIGGGHFNVYVNDKKVEDLGRLVRVDGETDLDLHRLTGHMDAWNDLYISLADLNITENGVYDIKVTHSPGQTNGETYFGDEYIDDYIIYTETELYHNSNLTLTSNVKVNYQNSSVELLTGFGMNPKLMYLDTYYDNIDDVTGKITVLNSAGEEIFSSDISALPSDENGRYLSYQDFKNDDFGDNITVIYSDGNQRSGQTTLNVLWRNATVDDFTPSVNSNVDDYYGDFVSLNIPDVINTGQIVVTIKFKNNHGSNISNMNVSTDFDSQAVYRFNIADIKENYGNDFNLALSDLGFYEDKGNYDIDVKFTGDGTTVMDVANGTVAVEFLKDIVIVINESSRYGLSLPFASVQIFEPISAYGELLIDGKIYAHKNFEKGSIIFESSPLWAAGIHTAELRVCSSEFGTILNSSKTTFETLTNTEDVNVSVSEVVKENEKVFVNITVPKAGKAIIQIDGVKNAIDLVDGLNTVDLGVLPHGSHTVWISYNVTLDDGNVSFYNNYLTLFVGDDGHWMNLPQPLVLEDDDTIKFNLGSDAEGYVMVIIDGEVYDNRTLVNGSVDIQINESMFGENKYGTHTYNITYSGDETHDSLSQAGTFDVTYLFRDDIDDEGYPLKENYEIVISLPNDADGNVTIVVDGKTYVSQVKDGKVTFDVSNLAEGEHDVNISYSGDAKYPAMTYSNVLNVSYYSVVGKLLENNRFVSLMLPANATGNLTVYNDNRRSVLFTKALVNGKASIDLNDLPVGIYDIIAYYEGDMLDVRSFAGSFKVMPKVNITQDVIIGDNVTVTMDLNEASGSILIVVDGLTPAICEIVDGKVNYTFSTEGLSYGNHTITFQYFGTSFDSSIFYELDEKTGRYVPVTYYWNALPKIVDPKMDSDDTTAYISVGNATGTIEIFVNGVSYAIVDIVNGIASIDLSSFANGNYLITWKYSGDYQYASFEQNSSLTINNRIVASALKMLYSSNKKYSVKVYGTDGNVLSGVSVKFLINNKSYKTVKTNSKGVASVVIKKNPGTYTITSKSLGVKVNKKLTVNHVVSINKAAVKKSANKLVLTAKLKKVNGKYLKGKKITFKFNGKKYTAKTNNKGVAKITISKSVLSKLKAGKKITYQATYLKDTVKRTAKVNK